MIRNEKVIHYYIITLYEFYLIVISFRELQLQSKVTLFKKYFDTLAETVKQNYDAETEKLIECQLKLNTTTLRRITEFDLLR